MQVFLSWSGSRSKAVAETFAKWIEQVIQAVEPWISSDIEKGARWNSEVAAKLEQSRVGIICLTKKNLDAKWILFESGALSKTHDAYVCTLLLDIAPTDVEQPLGQFQHTTRDKNDIRQLLRTINKAVQKNGDKGLTDYVLDNVFETNWPQLSEALDKIASEQRTSGPVKRREREMLQEILEIVRGQERRAERDKPSLFGEGSPFDLGHAKSRQNKEMIRRALRPDPAEWKEAVAEYLVKNKGGILSSEFASFIDEMRAEEDEKKAKGAQDRGDDPSNACP